MEQLCVNSTKSTILESLTTNYIRYASSMFHLFDDMFPMQLRLVDNLRGQNQAKAGMIPQIRPL